MSRTPSTAVARRLTLACAAGALTALTALTAAGPGAATTTGAEQLRPHRVPPAKTDYLKITVTGTGDADRDGTYTLLCHPAGGTHPQPRKACAAVDAAAGITQGRPAADRTRNASAAGPFAPVPTDATCTMVHGGDATARITGTWRGKPVNARFDRSNGCEMSRWDRLVPALPDLG